MNMMKAHLFAVLASIASSALFADWTYDGTAMTGIDIGPGIEAIRPYFLGSCSSLSEIRFAAIPAIDSNAFGITNYQSRVRFCRDNPDCVEYVSDAGNVTPWADLATDIQERYMSAYPGQRRPMGLTTAATGLGKQWAFTYTDKVGLQIMLR